MIKANLIHLSYNMWQDAPDPYYADNGVEDYVYDPALRFDLPTWREIAQAMADAGQNMVVWDVGDGVRYASHPELAVKNAWTPAQLREELQRCRDLGLEVIPKLNFSTCHDLWLGEYARMVSTSAYYAVVRDLIRELIELFDGPRFFHLGMDEETAEHQRHMLYAVMRQGALWWHDLNFLVEAAAAGGARAWVWSDKIWHCGKAEFGANMPKSVVQSNWYYERTFQPANETHRKYVQAFLDLDELGYDQIPTGSNWVWPQNVPLLVRYGREKLDARRLLGYMQTSWKPTLPKYRLQHLEAVETLRQAFE